MEDLPVPGGVIRRCRPRAGSAADRPWREQGRGQSGLHDRARV